MLKYAEQKERDISAIEVSSRTRYFDKVELTLMFEASDIKAKDFFFKFPTLSMSLVVMRLPQISLISFVSLFIPIETDISKYYVKC